MLSTLHITLSVIIILIVMYNKFNSDNYINNYNCITDIMIVMSICI